MRAVRDHEVSAPATAETPETENGNRLDRRGFLAAATTAAAATALAPKAMAGNLGLAGAPARYPDPAWVVHDDRFKKYMIGNTPLQREWTGSLWAEGSAWNGPGRYVVFSDIPNNRQLRWDEVTGEVTLLRTPSHFSNGNTFDFQGRQISCEHQTARVVRYGWSGPPEVLAESYDGKPLNAPNDAIVHPEDGGIIFTDPGYGSHWWYEGNVRELELPTSVYHIDTKSGKLTKLTDEIFKPNGIAFSADYKTIYVADTAPTHHPGEKAGIIAWDIEDNGRKAVKRRVFTQLEAGFHDGIRADRDGNVWAATAFGGEGIDGVHVYAPDGTKLGQIQIPESCANCCFVGERRNRLFICGSQSVYTIHTAAEGAHLT